MMTKKCYKCKNTYPLTSYSKDKSRKDGLQSKCRTCGIASNKTWQKQNLSKRNADRVIYNAINKEHVKNIRDTYFNENKERILKLNKDYYDKHPEKRKQYYKTYSQKNPAKILALKNKYRTSKLNRTPVWLSKEQLNEIEQFYKKAEIVTKQTGIKHHVDHIVPLQGKDVSGLHVPWNLQVIPATENLKKRNKI